MLTSFMPPVLEMERGYTNVVYSIRLLWTIVESPKYFSTLLRTYEHYVLIYGENQYC